MNVVYYSGVYCECICVCECECVCVCEYNVLNLIFPILYYTIVSNEGLGVINDTDDEDLPYEMIFCCYICTSMLGNYLYQIYTSSSQEQDGSSIFQVVLVVTAACYLVGSYLSSPMLIFGTSILIHLCMGAYWSCIGILRAQHIPPEYRSAPVTITK